MGNVAAVIAVRAVGGSGALDSVVLGCNVGHVGIVVGFEIGIGIKIWRI